MRDEEQIITKLYNEITDAQTGKIYLERSIRKLPGYGGWGCGVGVGGGGG